jgi:hypothetical protein
LAAEPEALNEGEAMFTNPRLVVAALVVTFALTSSAAANAAPATLTLSTGPDPAESIATQLRAGGASTNAATQLTATTKPTGGQGCGADLSADGGQTVYYFGNTVEEGPFSKSVNYTFDRAGSYLFCAWLNDDNQSGDPVVASASLTIAVRPPHLALSITAPTTVRPAQIFQITTTAQAEVFRTVTEFVLPDTGRGCPANSSAASSTTGVSQIYWAPHFGSSWSVDGGPFSESANETLTTVGRYLVCAYVEYPSEESPPEIAASAALAAAIPPPSCVVPHVRPGSKLASIEQRIRHAHCLVGPIHRVHSRRYRRRGLVLRLGAPAGRVLPFHTALAIFVSAARR